VGGQRGAGGLERVFKNSKKQAKMGEDPSKRGWGVAARSKKTRKKTQKTVPREIKDPKKRRLGTSKTAWEDREKKKSGGK